jgi:hypothetical protein
MNQLLLAALPVSLRLVGSLLPDDLHLQPYGYFQYKSPEAQ